MINLSYINKAEALRYMGYGSAVPEGTLAATIDSCEKALLSVIRPLYTYSIFNIEHKAEGVEVINTPLVLTGSSAVEHLQGCHKVVLMAATLGIEADKAIKRHQISDLTAALATDCLASAAIEQVCNEVEEEIRKAVDPLYMTWRFSPGYGDLPLALQQTFLAVLNAQKRIGLTLTDSLIMLPSKSVTAFIGLSENPIDKKRRGCAICNLRTTCQFRKRGERCVGN